MKKHNVWFSIVLAVFTLLYLAGNAGSAGKLAKATGTLTSIEQDGTVIINGSGYEVAASAKITNGRGERTTLDKFILPARVSYEFEYTKTGPLIRKIREMAQ